MTLNICYFRALGDEKALYQPRSVLRTSCFQLSSSQTLVTPGCFLSLAGLCWAVISFRSCWLPRDRRLQFPRICIKWNEFRCACRPWIFLDDSLCGPRDMIGWLAYGIRMFWIQLLDWSVCEATVNEKTCLAWQSGCLQPWWLSIFATLELLAMKKLFTNQDLFWEPLASNYPVPKL